jgi:hypothetical protein
MDFFDVVIIDEITSLLFYMCDPYKGKENEYIKNINIFLDLDRTKKIMLLDAFILHNPFETCIDTTRTLSIYNKYREELSLKQYKNKNDLMYKINFISNKESVSVSSNEKSFLLKLKKLLEKHGKKVLLLTGDSKNKDEIIKKIQNFGDANNPSNLKDLGYDVFLFSPVVTVGVSFYFDIVHHFHYDNSNSVDPINSIQMIRRVRNAKVIHYFIYGRIFYRSTNLEYIEKNLNGFKILNYRSDYLGVTHQGKRLAKIIYIRNILKNTHKYAFKKLMDYQFNLEIKE